MASLNISESLSIHSKPFSSFKVVETTLPFKVNVYVISWLILKVLVLGIYKSFLTNSNTTASPSF